MGGSLQTDPTPLNFTVGYSFVEMWGSLPPGIGFEDHQGAGVVFGWLQNQAPIYDITDVFPFAPGSTD